MELLELAEEYKRLRLEKDELKMKLSLTEASLKAINVELVNEMINNELQMFKDKQGLSFHLRTNIYATEKADLRDEFHNTLREEGYGDIVKTAVHSSTLRAFVKEQMAEHDGEVPKWIEDYVSIYKDTQVAITGMKKKG